MQRAALAGPRLTSFPNEAFVHWQLISRESSSATTKLNFHTLNRLSLNFLSKTQNHAILYTGMTHVGFYFEQPKKEKNKSPLQWLGLIFKAPKKLTCKPLFIHTTNINHIRLNFYIWYFKGTVFCSELPVIPFVLLLLLFGLIRAGHIVLFLNIVTWI